MIHKEPDIILPETLDTLKGFVNHIKADFITHAYPLVSPLVREERLSLASIEDIGAMKLNAIAHKGF